ncbi:MAG: dihydroneopterin aldolase [Chitinophagales bacterium]|nr:dihydroneopterin aldolase [Chitinophagales bacterium]MDW8427613.1 dihydroneopterin aldolase [Chitinophagales bacterium]
MLTIALNNIRISAPVGISAEERLTKSELLIDVAVCIQTEQPVRLLDDTLDYQRLVAVVQAAAGCETALLEQVCFHVVEGIRPLDDRIQSITVAVQKLHPPGMSNVGSAGVRYTWNRNADPA